MRHLLFEHRAPGVRCCLKHGTSNQGLFPFVVILLFLAVFRASAQSPPQLKAAVLGNIARFVQWPESSFPETNAPIRLGILGEDPFGPDLQTILDSIKIRGRAFSVLRSNNPRDLLACQIVFCDLNDAEAIKQAIAAFARKPILLVGQTTRFLDLGGMLNLYMEDRKVRFAVNLDAVVSAGLSINPQLLRLAATVKRSEDSK